MRCQSGQPSPPAPPAPPRPLDPKQSARRAQRALQRWRVFCQGHVSFQTIKPLNPSLCVCRPLVSQAAPTSCPVSWVRTQPFRCIGGRSKQETWALLWKPGASTVRVCVCEWLMKGRAFCFFSLSLFLYCVSCSVTTEREDHVEVVRRFLDWILGGTQNMLMRKMNRNRPRCPCANLPSASGAALAADRRILQ